MAGDKVTYTFVKQDGNIAFRSKVESFSLDHVTEKDATSFFKNFSNFSALDTGLLPVDGTGLLALRKAGNHTQITYQHKPGMYYINWGAHEGDRNAKSYFVAQPYRIVIIDLVDDNLLGARTFYSPIPATHPGIHLYHVNLPNINCKGYRGNGVGWICLYHNADWSQLPFNERLARALERCSGIETYNDQNMSETDGPRFYQDHYKFNPDYSYLWSPADWEKKSQEEGFEWTLNPDIWIPIRVKSRDEQDRHYTHQDAIELTLADAIIGKYNAYYGDTYHPKPINALTNPSLNLESKQVLNWFVQAYNSSLTSYVGVDTLQQSVKNREDIANTFQKPLPLDEEYNEDDENEDSTCDGCGEGFDSDSLQYVEDCGDYCSHCLSNNFVYCENTESYLPTTSSDLYYDETVDNYFDLNGFGHYKVCDTCNALHGTNHYHNLNTFNKNYVPNVWNLQVSEEEPKCFQAESVCSTCISDATAYFVQCTDCGCNTPDIFNINVMQEMYWIPVYFNVGESYPIYPNSWKPLCSTCASNKKYNHVNCVCGGRVPDFAMAKLVYPLGYTVNQNNYPAAYQAITDIMKSNDSIIEDDYRFCVESLCKSCITSTQNTFFYDNYDYPSPVIEPQDSNKLYVKPIDSVHSNLIDMMKNDKEAFELILNNATYSLYPLTSPF